MHRPNLTRRIATLRQAYTGETDSTLIPAAQAAACGFSPLQRDQVLTILDGDCGARVLGHPEPIVDAAIRSAVLLDTTVHRQHELDAAVLLALGRAHTYRGLSSAQRTLCRIVRPTTEMLGLSVFPQMLAVVLAELLPREQDGCLLGLAGLRLRLHRRHVELYLADAEPTVRVAISNTSYRQLTAALAFANTVTGSTTHPDDEPRPLSELEQLGIEFGRVPGPVALASALLRRLGLFRTAEWVSIEPVGAACLRIDWAGGLTPAYVASMLTHPITGLPDDRFTSITNPDGTIVVSCLGLSGVLCLRQHTETARPARTASAWAAFHHVISAPHPAGPASTARTAQQPA